MSILDQVRQQRIFQELDYARQGQQAEEQRNNHQTKRGVVDSIEETGAWVRILTSDGGGRQFVTIDVDKAYHEGQLLTINGDRGYF